LYVEGLVNEQAELQIMFEITSRIILWAVKVKYTGNMIKCRGTGVNNACLDVL
jgi:hypothetical protein